ncbi:hypothetical protein BGP75_03055 [Motiliproteus sp. MSK22-1]|nr:hypothetical protein BGP75_03055 [Motiliproteus sp. MSK22-1]
MLRQLGRAWIALLIIPFMAVAAQAAEYEEGVHYTRLAKQVRTQDPSKVEVVEMFGYWCPHCNNFERYLEPWKKKLGDQAYFKHIPVVFRPNQTEFAKAYYIAKALGVEDKTHSGLFSLIHRQRQWINNKEQLGEFFANYGVDEASFNKVYNSFSINSQLSSGNKKASAYQITGVPSLVVNGKYLVSAESAGSQRNMLKVVDYLIAKERAEL